MEIVIIPIATIVVFVAFSILGLMLCIRQRRKNQQVYVPRHNIVMPIQPTNPQFQMPMHGVTQQPIPQSNQHLGNNSMPVPQPFHTTSSMPDPPTFPTPDTASSPDLPTQSLMDRMRQVQTLMVEIHRLESVGGDQNIQRVRELKQRIVELSNTDEHGPLQIPPDLFPESTQPPPAYLPRDNVKAEGPGRA